VTRYVALFRGINVGKAKRIAMADLRALMASLGYRSVETLLNSGNVVFEGAVKVDHAQRIRAAVAQELGVDATVIVKSAADLRAIVAGNKLHAGRDPSKLLVAFATDARSLSKLAPLSGSPADGDEVHVGTHAAYAWCAKGLLDSKAGAAFLRELDGCGTTRNWATTLKLLALTEGKDVA
jgi:uncharacterized protein (DUF1697 family)